MWPWKWARRQGERAQPAEQRASMQDLLAAVEAVRSEVRRVGAQLVQAETRREGLDARLDGLGAQVAAVRQTLAEWSEWLKKEPEQRAAERRRVVVAFLPVGDALEQAQRALVGADPSVADTLQRLQARFLRVLLDCGAEPVAAEGMPFDPRVHRAVGRVVDPARPGRIVAVDRAGYAMDGEILRLADVVVGEAPPAGALAEVPSEPDAV